ncbi:MAG: hypothetical protein M3518_01100, partial [Actinomycetota bacterium]|nr:hypothetical protein [Actinomycetota bacterium]
MAGVLFLTLVFGPSWVQYFLLRRFGARPTSRWWNEWPFSTRWIAEGHKFAKSQFAIVCVVPGVFVWTVCILFFVFGPSTREITGV